MAAAIQRIYANTFDFYIFILYNRNEFVIFIELLNVYFTMLRKKNQKYFISLMG